MICTVTNPDDLDHVQFCAGDSGGPLFKEDGEKYVVYGVIQKAGTTCGVDVDAIYTEAACFRNWIYKTTKLDNFKKYATGPRSCGDGSVGQTSLYDQDKYGSFAEPKKWRSATDDVFARLTSLFDSEM